MPLRRFFARGYLVNELPGRDRTALYEAIDLYIAPDQRST